MNDLFYRAFEDRHRGTRDEVKARLKVYLPFMLPVASMHPDGAVLDLGCGRGEWLQLLQEHGISAQGVDLDEGMLEACHAQGFNVEKGDALGCLRAFPSESVIAVTAFHLVEHIGFDALRILVLDALRVLKPGGLLIMETPNPENIVVATKNFHMDPSHLKPLPPELLAFLPEHAGYARIKTLRLQESSGIHIQNNLSLEDVLGGASPDYAVVAQKRTRHEDADLLGECFSQEHGISTMQLAQRYGQQQVARHESLVKQVAITEAMIEQLQQALTETRNAAAQAEAWGAQLVAVYGSRSWKITAPLRWVKLQLTRIRQDGLIKRLKVLARKIFKVQQRIKFNGISQRRVPGISEQQLTQLTPHTRHQLAQLDEVGKPKTKD